MQHGHHKIKNKVNPMRSVVEEALIEPLICSAINNYNYYIDIVINCYYYNFDVAAGRGKQLLCNNVHL